MTAHPVDDTTTSLLLIGGFGLRARGRDQCVPLAVQRLLAFLALHGRPLERGFVAGNLWSDASERRAHANLRATLWRARLQAPLVSATDATTRGDDGDDGDSIELIVGTGTHLA